MGELIRSSFGKRYVREYAPRIRTAMAVQHQWGISVPGACEGLSHWRGTVEDMARQGQLGPVVVADLDQVNMFGNAEWPAIRDAVDASFVELAGWLQWAHQAPSDVVLHPAR